MINRRDNPAEHYKNGFGGILQLPFTHMMRRFAALAAFSGFLAGAWSNPAAAETRTLPFYNIHTKERVTITYKRDGEFIPEGMKQINSIMRDWRRNEPTKMDPELIDTIWEIYQDVGSSEPIHLVSGYRSRITNERLRRRGGGQARKSQHVLGKAADLHFPDVPVKRLRNSALVRQVGGVGYYPRSGLPFVHVDTGRVRHWPRIKRQELALLFPDGKTQHVPSDGRPLTPRDGRIALAKLGKSIDRFIEKKSKIKMPPKFMMADLTPIPMGIGTSKSNAETTAALPKPEKTPVPRDEFKRTAALAPVAPPAPRNPVQKTPAPSEARVVLAPVEEVEHPEELVYETHDLTPLLSETAVIADRHLATLIAPGKDEEGHLLRDPEDVMSSRLAAGLGYTHILTTVSYSEAGPKGDPAKPLRTASRQ